MSTEYGDELEQKLAWLRKLASEETADLPKTNPTDHHIPKLGLYVGDPFGDQFRAALERGQSNISLSDPVESDPIP